MSKLQPSRLDQIAIRVDTACKAALLAAALVRRPSRRSEDLDMARDAATEAGYAASHALEMLQAEGAQLSPVAVAGDIPLDKLDTPASRALLAALESAVKLAEVVDAERGFANPESARLHPSDTLGVDLAETINQIRARVSLEVYGATGKGLE